jgi:hypothetical protein
MDNELPRPPRWWWLPERDAGEVDAAMRAWGWSSAVIESARLATIQEVTRLISARRKSKTRVGSEEP